MQKAYFSVELAKARRAPQAVWGMKDDWRIGQDCYDPNGGGGVDRQRGIREIQRAPEQTILHLGAGFA
jgi:hypothetical protein